MKDEDYAYEQRRQRRLDAMTPLNKGVGTVIPFSRTVDRDPNPRIPLSVPENSYPKMSKREAAVWFVIGAVLVAWWTGVL